MSKQTKKYYQENQMEIKRKQKIYRYTHKIQIAKKKKEWYLKNKNKILKYKKHYRIINKNLLHQKAQYYYQENKLDIINKNITYIQRRLKIDIKFRILFNLRRRLYLALKGVNKSKHTLELIGCSIEFLHKYLQSKFTKGMSWYNYGYYGWHVDHIKPCASFDLSKKSEQRKCFHYTNLQPLWAKDNLNKGKKYE